MVYRGAPPSREMLAAVDFEEWCKSISLIDAGTSNLTAGVRKCELNLRL